MKTNNIKWCDTSFDWRKPIFLLRKLEYFCISTCTYTNWEKIHPLSSYVVESNILNFATNIRNSLFIKYKYYWRSLGTKQRSSKNLQKWTIIFTVLKNVLPFLLSIDLSRRTKERHRKYDLVSYKRILIWRWVSGVIKVSEMLWHLTFQIRCLEMVRWTVHA